VTSMTSLVRVRWLAVAVVATLVAVACDGGGAAVPAADGGTTGDVPAAATPAAGQPAQPAGEPGSARTVAVNQKAWHYGFGWEFLEATLYDEIERFLGQESRALHVTVRLTNLREEEASFRGRVAAVCAETGPARAATTETVWAGPDAAVGVTLESGETGEGVLRFGVDPCFDLDSGYLLLGGRNEHQASVPLGPAAPALIDLAPYMVTPGVDVRRELFDLSLVEVWVVAFRLHDGRALPLGERALYVYFDFTHRRSGSWSLPPPSLELTLPDGSKLAPAGWGPSFANLTSGSVHRLWLRFALTAEDYAGEYALTFTPGVFQGTDEDDSHTLTFTLAP
jgi:hypothetical protein